jgi:hypothetical protein
LVSAVSFNFHTIAFPTSGTLIGDPMEGEENVFAATSLAGDNQTSVFSVLWSGGTGGGSNYGTLVFSLKGPNNLDPPTSAGTLTVPVPPMNAMLQCNISGYIEATSISGSTVLGNVYVAGDVNGYWENVGLQNNATTTNVLQAVEINANEGGVMYALSAVGGGTETLLLNNPTPSIGEPLLLSGFNLGVGAGSLNCILDGGVPVAVSNFVPGQDWTGTGPLAQYGTHTLFVEDPITTVTSNTVTITVKYPVRQVQLL